MLTAGLQ